MSDFCHPDLREVNLAVIRVLINAFQSRAVKLIKELGDYFSFAEFEFHFVGKLPPERKNKLDVFLAFEEQMTDFVKETNFQIPEYLQGSHALTSILQADFAVQYHHGEVPR